MQTQILKAAMIAALLACAVGIAAFARGAYEYSSRVSRAAMLDQAASEPDVR
ncbi:MAG: hypothetical protein ACK4TP_07825 [Hyphomicrobium sp.]|jgi:hypothetical protein